MSRFSDVTYRPLLDLMNAIENSQFPLFVYKRVPMPIFRTMVFMLNQDTSQSIVTLTV